jgi:cytochrome b
VNESPGSLRKEKIWDLGTRLWHWAFAIAVSLSLLLGTFMSFDNVRWHFYNGYLILGLLGFRVIWGVVGPAPVRFRNFFPSPVGTWRYLKSFFRREPSGVPGHSPLGALSVYALLLAVLAQAGSGLFIESEDYFESAPLHSAAPKAVVSVMNTIHHTMPPLIVGLVALHIVAIGFYLIWKRENLAGAMVTGWKWVRRK